MALIDIWKASREELDNKLLQQLIAISGDGRLTDESQASSELRELLGVLSSSKLSDYAVECLEQNFDGSGFALQDVVNEIGRRLGFNVEDGLYRGKRGLSGHDGLWTLPNGHQLIVEVKTTDAYTMNLDTFAGYRKTLVTEANASAESSSILLVVGRKDTGGLEAQIRGSRHAWDMRIISVDALVRLMVLKESLDDPATVATIAGILVPREYTRVDSIIDIAFATAEEALNADDDEIEHDEETDTLGREPEKDKPKLVPAGFHDACAARVSKFLGLPLVKVSKTIHRSPDDATRVWIAVSTTYTIGSHIGYWFAFHPHQRESIQAAPRSFAVLGCGDSNVVFVIPLPDFLP